MSNPSSFSSKSIGVESANGSNRPEHAVHRIDVVLFDYGMVLSGPPDQEAWTRLGAVSGLDEARLHAAYWALRHDYDRGALTGTRYWQAVAAHAGVPAFDLPRLAALMAADIDLWSQLNPPMLEWAARLQRAGVRTGVLSNIGDAIGQGVVARMPWLAGFDHCAWSYAMRMAKPDPAIYLATAQALGTEPSAILFIDDREQNVVGAAGVGMQAMHYTGQAAFEREMRVLGWGPLLDAGRAGGDAELTTTTGDGCSTPALQNEPGTAAK